MRFDNAHPVSNPPNVSDMQDATAAIESGCLAATSERSANVLRPLSLRCNFSWAIFGNTVYAACQWGLLVALTKLGTPELVGYFVLAAALAAPIYMSATLQLRSLQATDSHEEYQFGEYFSVRLIAMALAFLCTLCVVFTAGYGARTVVIVVLFGLAKSIELIADVFYGLLHQHKRLDCVAKSMIVQGPLGLIALSVGVYLTGGLAWGLIALIATRITVLLTYVMPWGIRIMEQRGRRDLPPTATQTVSSRLTAHLSVIRPSWQWRRLGGLTLLGLPLAIVTLVYTLNANLPRYFVDHYFGKRELGIFGAIAALLLAIEIIARALNQASAPQMASFFNTGQMAGFRKLLLKLLFINLTCVAAGVLTVWVAGSWILTLLYQPEYSQYTDVLWYIMIAGGLQCFAGMVDRALISARHVKLLLPLHCLTTVVSLAACWYLIPSGGLTGAAQAFVVARTPSVVIGLCLLFYVSSVREQTIGKTHVETTDAMTLGRPRHYGSRAA